jgi:pimeloyl-ACP methyl ester carboxylesterase
LRVDVVMNLKKILIICFFLIPLCLYAKFSPNDLSQLQASYKEFPDGQIEYFKFGKGSPILLINGYGTTLSSWNRNFLSSLAQHHQIIIFNNRNIGQTFFKNKGYHSTDLANDAYRLVHALGIKNISVAGISMGGMIAQQFAVLHPELVSHLILINTAIAGHSSLKPNLFVEQNLFNPPTNRIKRMIVGIDLLAPPTWRLKMAVALNREGFVPKGYKVAVISKSTLAQQQNLILNWSNNDGIKSRLTKLSIPTLVLNGGMDAVIPPINSDILAKVIPQATLLRWPDGGHAMIYQYPYAIAEAINHFIT